MLGHIIFLGIFGAVLAAIAGALAMALLRALRDFRARRVEAICWQTTFPDLPANERICRHEFTGEFKQRTCDKAFDCRDCRQHAALIAQHPVEAADRFHHRGHTWVQPESDGSVTIGLDELGESLAAHPDGIELPAAGERLQVNGTGWYVRKRGARIRILSPVDGEVVATGGREAGWYLKVRPEGGKLNARHLLRGAEVRLWMAREMERLQAMVAPSNQVATLADGGMPVADMGQAAPDADWEAICGAIFLQA